MYPAFQRLVLAIGLMLTAGLTHAVPGELPKPSGEIILTVSGKISHTNAPGIAEFSRDSLVALGVASFTTSHSWADGKTTFEGVPLAKVLDAVGANGGKIRAVAVNNYAVELDVAELRRYPVLLALKADGTELRRRDRGPIWIVFPRDSYPELRDEKHNNKWIWQVRSLELQ